MSETKTNDVIDDVIEMIETRLNLAHILANDIEAISGNIRIRLTKNTISNAEIKIGQTEIGVLATWMRELFIAIQGGLEELMEAKQ